MSYIFQTDLIMHCSDKDNIKITGNILHCWQKHTTIIKIRDKLKTLLILQIHIAFTASMLTLMQNSMQKGKFIILFKNY